jgi:hypothetical protein
MAYSLLELISANLVTIRSLLNNVLRIFGFRYFLQFSLRGDRYSYPGLLF